MLKLPSYLTGFSSKADGSASIRFATQELSADDFALLKQNLNEFGWLVFKPNEFKEEEVPKEDAVEDWDKPPSQRLRAVLFRLWEKNGKKGTAESHYKAQMEKLIEHIKTKLD